MNISRHGVVSALSRYVSPNTANGILRWVNREYQLDPDRVREHDLARFVDALDTGAKPFLSDTCRNELKAALLASGVSRPSGLRVFAIRNETDVSKARLGARLLCQEAGATSLACLQLATSVSEVARNILLYAGSGEVELAFQYEPERTVSVHARDRGPGISNLEEILGGSYQSKTGMGRGLLGVRRIATRFKINTSETGTSIEFEVKI